MDTINAPMTSGQTFVPLTTPGSVPAGTYDLDGETIAIAATIVDGGQACVRGLAGTTARRHSVGESLSVIPPDAIPSVPRVIARPFAGSPGGRDGLITLGLAFDDPPTGGSIEITIHSRTQAIGPLVIAYDATGAAIAAAIDEALGTVGAIATEPERQLDSGDPIEIAIPIGSDVLPIFWLDIVDETTGGDGVAATADTVAGSEPELVNHPVGTLAFAGGAGFGNDEAWAKVASGIDGSWKIISGHT